MEENIQKKKTKKWKVILSIVLVCVTLISSVAGSLVLLHQPKALVNDFTVAGRTQNSEDEANEKPEETQAVINPNVTMFQDDKAKKINKEITNITTTSAGVYMTVKSGTEIDKLGVGDIFFLDGSEKTPMGEPYFGKIVSTKTQSGNTNLLLETPKADEVFDKLSFDTDDLYKDGVTATVETVEGVTVKSGATTVSNEVDNTSKITTLSNTGNTKVVNLNETVSLGQSQETPYVENLSGEKISYNPKKELKLEITVDLLKAYKKLKGDKKEDESEYVTDNGSIIVAITKYGYAYHEEDCFHLKASETVEKVPLINAITAGRTPCKHCKPSVYRAEKEDVPNESKESLFDTKLELTGEVGIENLICNIYYDWDIINGNGMQDLFIDVTGTAFANVGLNGAGEMELGGDDTEWSDPLGAVKLQGLEEKLFPIAFINLTQSFSIVHKSSGNKETVEKNVGTMPISVLVIAYVDVKGNLTFSVSAEAGIEKEFSYKQNLVKNGEFNLKSNMTMSEPEVTWSVEAAAEADVDAHVGISAMLYVFNINLLDVGLVKIGAEAEGKAAIKVDQDTVKDKKPWFDASYYMRFYVKLLDIKLKLKCKVDLFYGIVNASFGKEISWTALDMTLASWGEKLKTWYSDKSMSCSRVTARDTDATYYKDEDGRLIMEKDNSKSVLYDEEFFTFCAIDDSYLYILKENEDGDNHSMYRISKQNKTAKQVLNSVSSVLYYDEEYIYYLDGFDNTVVRRLKREDLTTSEFSDFEHNVEYINEQNGGLYVITTKSDAFSWLFGATNYYYLLNKEGKIVTDYGSDIKVTDYCLFDKGNYYEAAKMVGNGALRSVAAEILWMSKDKTQTVVTNGISGWVAKTDVGIFTTLDNDDNTEGSEPYRIMLCAAKDGVQKEIVPVSSNQAFFTLVQDNMGDWYFFDQTDEELILYTMDENFSSKKKLKSFSLEELSYNLTDCGMEIMDGCLYFYTIYDETKCKVIKRYSLY